MKMFDPHIHMTSRTTDDYQKMAEAGITVVCEPAFWMGQPRTHASSFEDYFLSLVGWERFRASQFGIHHFCTIALNPKEANNANLADDVLAMMPRYLEKESVIAVGEIGLDDQTDAEVYYLKKQVELAKEFELPVLVHTPHRDKKHGSMRCIDIILETGIDPSLVLIDHNNEETIEETLRSGCWAGHSIYPETKMDEERMARIVKRFGPEKIIINSAADWGVSDTLMVPKTVAKMRDIGVSEADIERVVWDNPIAFFAQSGRITKSALEKDVLRDQTQLFSGNSVLRGQTPQVDSI
ncbi:MAG: TatD family hydrolase [Pseudobacteriovorax sp.]|nr:TatD family hydrolase [Pseudobacteriovorax sp.]